MGLEDEKLFLSWPMSKRLFAVEYMMHEYPEVFRDRFFLQSNPDIVYKKEKRGVVRYEPQQWTFNGEQINMRYKITYLKKHPIVGECIMSIKEDYITLKEKP